MPRPKNQDAPMKSWDVRITPSDQQPIEFTPTDEDYKVFVACMEGGTEDLRLHYHIYCESNRSETYLDKQFNTWGRATAVAKGNAIFSKRKAHEGTIGYCVKGGQVVARHGWTDLFLEEMLTKSKNYRRDIANTKKRALRQKENFLATILKEVAEQLTNEVSPTPPSIMALILAKYDKLNVRLPNRNTLETAVMTLLYRKSPSYVLHWYSQNLELRN